MRATWITLACWFCLLFASISGGQEVSNADESAHLRELLKIQQQQLDELRRALGELKTLLMKQGWDPAQHAEPATVSGPAAQTSQPKPAAPAQPAKPPSAEAENRVMVQGTVTAVDYEKRTVTIRGRLGQVVTLDIAPTVTGLERIKVGDSRDDDLLRPRERAREACGRAGRRFARWSRPRRKIPETFREPQSPVGERPP